ncbi:hypothetical protein ACFSRY_15165 [Pontibacter locisalis]|uniref:Uncharacterized protein n=1 Tax=Pontibacter locisalis TaxID=1719035 RepID=A0ABW5INL4_9BACT
MTTTKRTEALGKARDLMESYSRRTGLLGTEGDISHRYLWTDAFAVQTFFGLAHALDDAQYKENALKLITAVHETLGRFRKEDRRSGWISGLPEKEGAAHPTAGGLRIGKKLPERAPGEPMNERLEWERDGQYFHYLTRWVNALLLAAQETGEPRYAAWATELIQAGGKFLYKTNGRSRMYWKMSIDLTRPLVTSMGAHDPLEGLICAESARLATPQKANDLEPLIKDFETLCAGQDWATTDPLGLGGLLLNAVRAAELGTSLRHLPEEIKPEKLLTDSLDGLKVYAKINNLEAPAQNRLAFRECGLSLGLSTLCSKQQQLKEQGLDVDAFTAYFHLANAIEDFWGNPDNQRVSTWIDHKDINTVSLAASLVANYAPIDF